jgi:hypothetical protein
VWTYHQALTRRQVFERFTIRIDGQEATTNPLVSLLSQR